MTNSSFCSEFPVFKNKKAVDIQRLNWNLIIAYLIWKGSYNTRLLANLGWCIIAYLIWKGSYNANFEHVVKQKIIAYLIWKGSYNTFICFLQF